MMVANSANLIVTVKPVNQRNNVAARGGVSSGRSSVKSTVSYLSARSQLSARDEKTHLADGEECDEDVVKSHLTLSSAGRQMPTAADENVLATV